MVSALRELANHADGVCNRAQRSQHLPSAGMASAPEPGPSPPLTSAITAFLKPSLTGPWPSTRQNRDFYPWVLLGPPLQGSIPPTEEEDGEPCVSPLD